MELWTAVNLSPPSFFVNPLDRGLVSSFIGQALAFNRCDGVGRSALVINAEGDTVIVAEFVLGKIAVQVLLGAMLIDALHAALEDAEYAFDGVGVDAVLRSTIQPAPGTRFVFSPNASH